MSKIPKFILTYIHNNKNINDNYNNKENFKKALLNLVLTQDKFLISTQIKGEPRYSVRFVNISESKIRTDELLKHLEQFKFEKDKTKQKQIINKLEEVEDKAEIINNEAETIKDTAFELKDDVKVIGKGRKGRGAGKNNLHVNLNDFIVLDKNKNVKLKTDVKNKINNHKFSNDDELLILNKNKIPLYYNIYNITDGEKHLKKKIKITELNNYINNNIKSHSR